MASFTIYDVLEGTLLSQTGVPRVTEEAVWIDLLNPTQEEEGIIERGLKCDVPTREELQEIEASSRLYQEDGAFFMTATLVFKGGGSEAQVTPATFILVGNRLLTVRYAEPGAFALFLTRCSRQEMDLNKGCMVLIGLLEAVVDRLVGFIEHIQAQVEQLSHSVFKNTGTVAKRQRRYDVVLQNIGHEGEVVSKVRESCHSLGRLLTYLAYAVNERKEGKVVTSRVRAAVRDVNSLTDHATFLCGTIVFLLDATRCDAGYDPDSAERHHQDFLGGSRGLSAADIDCIDLRDEFPGYAGTQLGPRLPCSARHDDPICDTALSLFQA